MGHGIDDVPDPHSTEQQPEPDEEEHAEQFGDDIGDMPDYGMDDKEYEGQGPEFTDQEPESEQNPDWLRKGEHYISAAGLTEPEDELNGTNKLQRPGQNPYQSTYSEPERNWKSRRKQQYVGESTNRIAPTIKKNGVYVFDKDNDWPTLVEVLEVDGSQAKVQLIGAFKSPNDGKSYWVSTRDLKPDRI
jgi:hypothetical protein